jgi:hypothetical protein
MSCGRIASLVRVVPVTAELTLFARPRLVAMDAAGVLVIDAHGNVLVLTHDLHVAAEARPAASHEVVVATSGSASWLASADGDSLGLRNARTGRTATLRGDRIEAVAFADGDRYLWAARRSEPGTFDVEIWSREGARVASHRMSDRFGSSSLSFHAHPAPDHIDLWIAAGQDGTESHELVFDGAEVRSRPLRQPKGNGPPVFTRNGRMCASSAGEWLNVFGWPDLVERRPVLAPDDVLDPGGDIIAPLSEFRMAWVSPLGRLRVVDVSSGCFVEEVCIEGHEPGPVGRYYPRLEREEGLASDIRYVICDGELVLAITDRTLLMTRAEAWVSDDVPLYPSRASRA